MPPLRLLRSLRGSPAGPGEARRALRAALLLLICLAAASCGRSASRDWSHPNGGLAGTRTADATLDASNVAHLHVLWRFHLTSPATFSGIVAATPLVVGNRVYVQDLDSNVVALDRRDGHLVWRHRFGSPSGGPNGLSFDGDRLYGNTNVAAFALDARDGRLLWFRPLTAPAQPLTIAPLVANGIVVTSTTGESAGGRGALVALDAATGRLRWTFDTIAAPWSHPKLASGGGAWETPTLDGHGHLWVGTANPNPWGGSRRYPNGAMYPGPVRWTDSLLELDLRTGKLIWAEQVTPHDIRDYDFQDPPLQLGRLVVGAGKAGSIVAWDRATHRRAWTARVGAHRSDTGPLPPRLIRVCPGLLGGVETPMAAARGRIFVPVVDLCSRESALGTSLGGFLTTDYAAGRGALVALDTATGRPVWQRALRSPVFGCATVSRDVVFTITYAGTILALRTADGRMLWSASAPAAVNACPAVAGNMLVVAAGAAYPHPRNEEYEVVAYAA